MQAFYDRAVWSDSHLPKELWINNEDNPASPDEDGYNMKKTLYVFHVKVLSPYTRKYHVGYFIKNEYCEMWYDEEGHTVCFNEDVDCYFPIKEVNLQEYEKD